MRKLAPSLAFLIAACASETPPPGSVTPVPSRGSHQHGHLASLSAQDLGELFGAPAFQVREGPGLKLQWRGGGCVLDAYLYPPENSAGIERVTYVDARLASGAPIDPATCERDIEASR